MEDNKLDELLGKLPDIAEAVNKFQSEALQQQAFNAVMANLGLKSPDPSPAPVNADITPDMTNGDTKTESKGTPRKKSRSKRTFTHDKHLNLRPSGKQAFQEFVTAKSPTNNNDRIVTSIYYLTETLELPAVGVSQILACFMEALWRLPSDPVNAVQQAGSRGWVDSSDSENLILTPSGRNTVEHDLPRATK